VLRHGDAILARVAAARTDLHALAAGDAGPLRVGAYPSVGARLLPELLPTFAAGWPGVEVQVRESNSDAELLTWIERGELEFAFCMLPLPGGPFEAVELLRDPWLLVLPASASLRGNAPQAMVSFRTCPTLDEAESLLRRVGIQPSLIFRSDDNATLQALVAAGVGAAFMPCLTVALDDERVVFVDVRDRLPPRRVGVVWHRDRRRSAASHAFVEAAEQAAGRVARQLAPARFAMLSAKGSG
jgi:DNA-binding transcriptional LysR family regulator